MSTGIALCKVVNFVEKVSITVSFLHLGALAIDRFLAVFYPCKSMVSIRSSKITVAIIWGFSICYWGPILYFGGLGVKDGQTVCAVREFTPYWEYWYVLFLVLLFATLVLILVLYLLVAFKLWLRKLPGHQMSSILKGVDRSKRRMARMISIIVAAFYICFLPYWIGWISCSYLVTQLKTTCNPTYEFISILLLHSNCSINPIICLLFNLQYRLELKISLQDPLGLRVKAMRISYRRRKTSEPLSR
ncbi:substance-P receptor-like [Actinia tenebrosa]|uniref:Substance-P receptor-like n=1 Tax=Actinia tenebrosa TaxID=6105 RepID=A0A6P8J1A9_ACTTE|nr:substance-P receptor-like [Actinia tenebrosa]